MSFKNIKGQDRPINILRQYIENSCLQGGYLFTGPEGVGKKLAAKTTAKAVNCLQESTDSCDACASCLKIEKGQHPDFHIMESGDAEIKIEFIRGLQREINFKPYEGKTKVFIIDNAHRMTAEASNALLKILEETPGHSLIILITDKPALMFKTIISRCKIIKFLPLKRPALEEILKNDYGLDNNTAHFLAYFSEGRIGCALRLKDTEIFREKNRVIDRFVISARQDLGNLPAQGKEDLRNSLNILATWFRDIYLIKTGMPHSEIINFDRKEELLSAMGKFSYSDLNEILRSISDSVLYLEQNANIKLLLHNLSACCSK